MSNKSEYESLYHWKRNNEEDYQSAYSQGFIDDICEYYDWEKPKKQVGRLPHGYWTKAKVIEDALSFEYSAA